MSHLHLLSEISDLITEYKDNNYIRVRNSRMAICVDPQDPKLAPTVQNEVKVRNGLYTVTLSPMIFSGSRAFRCYLIHSPDYEIEQLSHIELPFDDKVASGWHTLKQITIATDGGKALTIDMSKPSDTCLGAYNCRCRFATQEEKEFDALTSRCNFCHHNRNKHRTGGLLDIAIYPFICPQIYGDERCLILPVYYSGYNFSNIMYGFGDKAFDDYRKAHQIITESKGKGLPDMSFPIPAGKDVRYYLPTATAQGNRIYITNNGVAKVKNRNKVMQEIDINEGNAEIKELYALYRRKRDINSHNITRYPYLIALQQQIMNDPAYNAKITVVVGDDWRSYHFLDKPYDR